ncbi:hypothetical protein V9T40_002840 [Parthenolecanium corni]|uniref:Zinc transporter ZIP13 n=1 Tax=Parthenolecanium corni TaxID=536013 RepID=A0AAN9Y4U9_9HEMI
MFCGMWVLAGLLAFIIIEKVFTFEKDDDEDEENEKNFVAAKMKAPLSIKRKRSTLMLNDPSINFDADTQSPNLNSDYLVNNNNGEEPKLQSVAKKDISGYLNLMANMIDNFTHGLAVGGSFMLSTRVGVFTTFAILVHEIPHEIGDFAILLRAGFSRWDAAWSQLYTASAGVLGAFTALMFNSSANDIEARTSWILPFTAGGFLHIALVTVLPELLDEKNPKESLKQMCSLASGITVMAVLTSLVEG